MKDKEVLIDAVDIIRTVADHQTGAMKFIGRILNKAIYFYYKSIKEFD